MSPDIGRAALSLALALAVIQTTLASVGATRESAFASARRSSYAAFAGIAIALAVLIAGFVQSDFSLANVAANSHTAKPLIYRVAAAWGSHEGSMLLWCLVLTGYGAAFAATSRGLGAIGARTLAAHGALSIVFLGFTLFLSSPFTRLSDPPLQGRGFNPLLQDPALAAHPPILYLGYVGLSVPFAIAVAALWSRSNPREGWPRLVRRWTLAAFSFLTVGIALGAYWAYYELGWGGWWFWDPVENASFIPWLVAAALLHSALATERGGALAGWTVLLAIMAFSLSMFGAFLTRSGVLTSVHAFAVDPQRGIALLAILTAAAGAALTLFALRAQSIAGRDAFAPVSREGAILANNVFLMTVASIVWLGTTWPLFAELATGARVSVGAPYFERAAVPILGAAALAAPFGPMLAWRAGDAAGALRRLWPAALVALMAGAALLVVARGGSLGAAVAVALGAWAILGAAIDFARRTGWPGRGVKSALRAIAMTPRALASPIAHAGVGLFALGAGVEAALQTESQAVMVVGDEALVDGRQVTLESMRRADGPNYAADRAVVSVRGPSGESVDLQPERRLYPANGQTTTEVAIRSTIAGDLYVALGPPQPSPDGRPRWPVRVLFNPLIWMVFAGAGLIAAGAGAALIKRRSPAREPAQETVIEPSR